jgi:hypothetical protein
MPIAPIIRKEMKDFSTEALICEDPKGLSSDCIRAVGPLDGRKEQEECCIFSPVASTSKTSDFQKGFCGVIASFTWLCILLGAFTDRNSFPLRWVYYIDRIVSVATAI